MSGVLRRLGLLVAVVSATVGLSLAAPRADAAPEATVRESGRAAEVIALAKQVAERQQSLHSLNQRADARDRLLIGYRAVLAKYGYTGDPDLARVVLPLASYDVSAGFGLTGPLWEAQHGGQDFGASFGDPLVAVADGTITEVADAGPYGLRTILTLADGTEVWYCHQTSVSVAAGVHREDDRRDRHGGQHRQLHRSPPAPRGAARRRQPHRSDGLAARRGPQPLISACASRAASG